MSEFFYKLPEGRDGVMLTSQENEKLEQVEVEAYNETALALMVQHSSLEKWDEELAQRGIDNKAGKK